MPNHRTLSRISSDPLLASVRGCRDEDARIQVATLTAVLDWATVHGADAAEVAELLDPMVEPALHLAGPGAPVIGEYPALDLALSLGMTSDGGLGYLAKALELRHRLPRLYARVITLEVPVWKAFRVDEATIALPVAGAAAVDTAVAPFLGTCSWAQVDRVVDAACGARPRAPRSPSNPSSTWPPTRPPRRTDRVGRSANTSAYGTGPACSRAAAVATSIWTTSSPSTSADPPALTTSRCCAAATTGPRPTVTGPTR